MARFEPLEAYQAENSELELLPIRFERRPDSTVLVSNFVGDMSRFTAGEFEKLVALNFSRDSDLYRKAYALHFIAHKGSIATKQLLALRMRSRMSFMQTLTPLHIFVVSLRCEHSCPYCQVSRQNLSTSHFDMPEEIAFKALDIALSTPTDRIKVEFQGGEPLLNFALIKTLVLRAKELAPQRRKTVDFVIATNLALLTDEILEFCKEHGILLSTSLDGPKDLHNKNRPRPGNNSYELAVAGIKRAQSVLGRDRVGALMTTTDRSLDRVEEIVDEYVALNLDGIFLRPLSPYGFAIKTRQYSRYDSEKWHEFYERGLRYVLEINRRGLRFPEFYTALLLQRMLTDRPIGYVDLRSPSGVGLGALVYNYDGKVFASDEGRMLAEMKDDTFELGNVRSATYESLVLSEKLLSLVSGSLSQTAPECRDCVFEPHCGADPVYYHATQRDALGIKPLSGFCSRQKSVMNLLFELMQTEEIAKILRGWVN